MEKLSDNLFSFHDTCNTYLLKDGAKAVLIDFGAGEVIRHLESLGVERLRSVLMTHHHRDQGQELHRAVEAGARIWVPYVEQDLFYRVDDHWQARELYNSYNNRQDRFSLLESVPIEGTLKDYTSYHFGRYTFEVFPTPGHTPGSLTLLTEVDGKRLAFTGDLIAGVGKLWSLAATQWTYNGAEGVAASIASLLALKERKPDVLLPSHGAPMEDPAAAIDLLVERLWELLRARGESTRLFSWRERPYKRLTPHLLWNRTSMAYGYVLLSDSGKALLIDYGYDFMTGFAAGSDRASRRPWLYTLPLLKRDFGVTSVDVVLPTHYHDDHVAGFNLLREVEGAEVWASENVARILRHPGRYDLPCLWYDPIPVDRELPVNEPIRWQEHSLTLFDQPGHTTHAVAISLTVDGKRVLAIGDQYQGGRKAKWNYVYNNGFAIEDYKRSAALYRQVRPDLILSGHWEPYWTEVEYFDRLVEQGEILSYLHRDLHLPGAWDATRRDRWLTLRPYQVEVALGEEFRLDVEAYNPLPKAEEVSVLLVLPKGWRADPERASAQVEAGAMGYFAFTVTPLLQKGRRFRVTADVQVGSRKLEQQGEVLVTAT